MTRALLALAALALAGCGLTLSCHGQLDHFACRPALGDPQRAPIPGEREPQPDPPFPTR